MNRIQRVVERGKAEMREEPAQGSSPSRLFTSPVVGQSRTNCDVFADKKVALSKDHLEHQRVVAFDELDSRATYFQILRTKVLQQMRSRGWSALAVSAPRSGAGKSLVAVNLAVSMAKEGSQLIVLVDLNLKKPTIHDYFGLEPEYGVHDLVDGGGVLDDALISPDIEQLLLLPGRGSVANVSISLHDAFASRLLEQLKKRYRNAIFVFDLPPVLESGDVLVLMPYIDCSLLVVESGRNNQKDVEDALKVFGSNPILGTVLNKVAQR